MCVYIFVNNIAIETYLLMGEADIKQALDNYLLNGNCHEYYKTCPEGCDRILKENLTQLWGQGKRSSLSPSWKYLLFIPKMSFFLDLIFISAFKYHSIINYTIKVLSHIPSAPLALYNLPWFCTASFFWALNRAVVLTWDRTTLVGNLETWGVFVDSTMIWRVLLTLMSEGQALHSIS